MPEPATSDPTGRVAVLVVRDGALPSGAHDTVRAAGGDVVVVGHGASSAAVELVGAPAAVRAWDTPGFAPGAWAVALAPLLERYRVVVLPASLFGGAAFLIACDVVARTALAPLELPVGVVTAMIGGPFFLFLLVRNRREVSTW